jgi:protein-S-isoprenylcysteine O-methyltransferase Ste14
MTETSLHTWLVVAVLATAVPTFLLLLRVAAPYGRHVRPGWGPSLPNRIGWIVMEAPAVLGFTAVYLLGAQRFSTIPLVLCGMWLFHYVYRTLRFPFLLPPSSRRIPVAIVAAGVTFNLVNAYLNARWISQLGRYPDSWAGDPRFLFGAAVFFVGLSVNRRADLKLLAIRKATGGEYRIPRGGLFERVSCPNYLGEIVEWAGWAIATWSGAGLAFAVYTTANLLPRALSNHRWYRERFDDYPPKRRALVPFVL